MTGEPRERGGCGGSLNEDYWTTATSSWKCPTVDLRRPPPGGRGRGGGRQRTDDSSFGRANAVVVRLTHEWLIEWAPTHGVGSCRRWRRRSEPCDAVSTRWPMVGGQRWWWRLPRGLPTGLQGALPGFLTVQALSRVLCLSRFLYMDTAQAHDQMTTRSIVTSRLIHSAISPADSVFQATRLRPSISLPPPRGAR